MHGAGNDYVYVDGFVESLPDDLPTLARRISDRRTGVGADGLILILPDDQTDARMRMFNADGTEAEMCGNGLRCVAKFLYETRRPNPTLRIATAIGPLRADITDIENNQVRAVRVEMGRPQFDPAQIPTTLPGHPPKDVPLHIGDHSLTVTALSMGNPHCVLFVDRLSDWNVHAIGPQIEHAPEFPNRVNVEFVEIHDRDRVVTRVWERGSGETAACGTGACAIAVAGRLTHRLDERVTIEMPGGTLEVEWDGESNVLLTGPAVEVFRGDWPI